MAAPAPSAAPAPAAGFESLERELSQMMMHGAGAVKQEPQMEQEPKLEVPVKESGDRLGRLRRRGDGSTGAGSRRGLADCRPPAGSACRQRDAELGVKRSS